MTSKPYDFSPRFGFLVNEVGRLYGRRFDQLSRQQLGLSRAQCRLLGVLASHEGERPLSQAELADRLDLTAMGVASLCERMETAGWIRRSTSPTDRRINEIELQPRAMEALDAALVIGDRLQSEVLATLDGEDRERLLVLLRRVHANLVGDGSPDPTP
jgi:DNA-binding MarR family transcriptional regulator